MPVPAEVEADIKALITERFGIDPDCYRITSADDLKPGTITFYPFGDKRPMKLKGVV